jgi:hypothetical protein
MQRLVDSHSQIITCRHLKCTLIFKYRNFNDVAAKMPGARTTATGTWRSGLLGPTQSCQRHCARE